MILGNYYSQGRDKKVLITSGWHGDEPDGIALLNTYDFTPYFQLNIFTVNEINEWGCKNKARTDRNGLSPDDGFMKRDEQYQQVMSIEAKSIKSLETFLRGYDIHIALHNDPKKSGYYTYTWGDMTEVEGMVSNYYDKVGKVREYDPFIDLKDGSYYDYMYNRYGQKCIIIETGIYGGSQTDLKLVLGHILQSL